MDLHDDLQELSNPLAVVHGLLGAANDLNFKALYDAVSSHFNSRVLCSPEVLQRVPILTSQTAEAIPSGSLVRLRGMVTDMYNPEFFLGAYRGPPGGPAWTAAALYTDDAPLDIAAAASGTIMDRRPLLLSPVPYEAAWATAAWAGCPPQPPTPCGADRIKRSRGHHGTGGAAADTAADTAAAPGTAAAAAKQARQAAGSGSPGGASELQQARDQGDRRQQQQEVAAGQDEDAHQAPPYWPGDCIVQVYGDADQFKLHDVVEVLGVLSVVPGLAALHMNRERLDGGGADGLAGAGAGAAMDVDGGGDDEDDLWEERVAALPPTSQVLRVHALCTNKLAPSPLEAAAAALQPAQEQQDVALLRGQAVSLLATALGGDELAAEYLLLTCLSTVVGRDESGAVGLLPLNISHCPTDGGGGTGSYAACVAAALSCLLPHMAPLPLTLDSLNTRRWYPQQHAASGRLLRGCLQAPEGTLLLLDETAMAAGQLGEAGLKNLQALHQVLTQQQLPCGCQVYATNLAVSQPTVILSAAGRSLLRDAANLLQLPLAALTQQQQQQQEHMVTVKPGYAEPGTGTGTGSAADGTSSGDNVVCPEAVAAAAAVLPDLAAVRRHLALARRAGVALDQGAAEACVARFRALQAADADLGWQDLHVLITLAKLLCASMGQRAFSLASWDRAVQLEQMRKARVAAMAPQQAHPQPQRARQPPQQQQQQAAEQV